MRVLALSAAALLASCSAPQPFAQPRSPVEIAGRAAGAPIHCLPAFDRQQLRVSESDPSTIVYGSGKTIWVSHLGPYCSISWTDIPVFEVTGASYCSGDLVHSIDRTSHMTGPTCVLGDFVPFTRP